MDDVRRLFEERDRWQILDVREAYEWDAGHIDGAIHVPLNDVMGGGADRGRLDAGRPVAVICRSGNRSELAALMLRARGYQAENVEGGMESWDREGLPFVSSDPGPARVV